jgi:glycosyltransferase involved in cell wall biosynthesis
MLLTLERLTYRVAHRVISTNESYREVAMSRGGRSPADITVVRSGPDTSVMRPIADTADLRHGRRYLACYLGIMGPQDGVDLLLRAVDHYVHALGREDCHFGLMGFGDCLEDLKLQCRELGLDDYVTFTGRADSATIAAYLSAADVGLSPDPLSPLNDVSTMNKTMEYMAFAVPVLAFDLKETRVSAGDAAVYVGPGDVEAFAKSLGALLDDDAQRADMAVQARRRAAAELDWRPQARAYVGVYDALLGVSRDWSKGTDDWPAVERRRTKSGQPRDVTGRRLVDLRNIDELREFVKHRKLAANDRSETDPW